MLLSLGLFGLLGCPLPPDESSNTTPSFQNGNIGSGGQNGGNNNPAGNGGKPKGAPPSVGENQGGSGSGGTAQAGAQNGGAGGAGGTLMDMEQMKSQKKQEEIEKLDHVTIKGTVQGECTGLLRLDVINTEELGGPKDGGEMKGPITTKILESVGEFSVVVPKSSSVNLSVICDADRNSKITADVDQLSLGARLGVVDEDVSDVTLTLEAIKPPSGDLPPPK